MDASSWAKRQVRDEKKFAAGRKYIPELFSGFSPLPEIEQIALFGFGGPGGTEDQTLLESRRAGAVHLLANSAVRAACRWGDAAPRYARRYGQDTLNVKPARLLRVKNGADIKLCLDATEGMIRFPRLTTLVIMGADSDVLPVSQKIKAAGRTLVGVGIEAATNRHWAHSCHEFRYYGRSTKPCSRSARGSLTRSIGLKRGTGSSRADAAAQFASQVVSQGDASDLFCRRRIGRRRRAEGVSGRSRRVEGSFSSRRFRQRSGWRLCCCRDQPAPDWVSQQNEVATAQIWDLVWRIEEFTCQI